MFVVAYCKHRRSVFKRRAHATMWPYWRYSRAHQEKMWCPTRWQYMPETLQDFIVFYPLRKNKCCDPLSRHKKQIRKDLRPVSLTFLKSNHHISFLSSLVPGEKMCLNCLKHLKQVSNSESEKLAVNWKRQCPISYLFLFEYFSSLHVFLSRLLTNALTNKSKCLMYYKRSEFHNWYRKVVFCVCSDMNRLKLTYKILLGCLISQY